MNEAADWLGINRKTLRAMVRARKIGFIRINRRKRFTSEILDGYIRQTTVRV